jgi:hypothetical protein
MYTLLPENLLNTNFGAKIYVVIVLLPSQAAHLLKSWVRIPPGAWIFVCCECRVFSGRGLCDELITRPEEFHRLCCVVVCNLEISRIGAPYIYDISNLRVKRLEKREHEILKMFLIVNVKFFYNPIFYLV